MEDPKPWIRQGDIFRRVWRVVRTVDDGIIKNTTSQESALLVSHGCDLDKKDASGHPAIVQLIFAPISLATNFPKLDAGLLRKLKDGAISPPSLVYIPVEDGQAETVANLGQTFFVPAEYFEPRLQDFTGRPDLEDDTTTRLVLGRTVERTGTLSESEVAILHNKITVFFTRTQLEVPE